MSVGQPFRRFSAVAPKAADPQMAKAITDIVVFKSRENTHGNVGMFQSMNNYLQLSQSPPAKPEA